jgi:hypothetical protein
MPRHCAAEAAEGSDPAEFETHIRARLVTVPLAVRLAEHLRTIARSGAP